ncbi:hypothetical protein ACXWOD_09890, partial [Streptococcus pyogenes]
YAVIALNLLGGVATAAVQSIISNAASATHQGQAMGAVSSLNSVTAVLAPVIGLTLLGWVSHLPAADLRMGLPFFACAGLQLLGLVVAYRF